MRWIETSPVFVCLLLSACASTQPALEAASPQFGNATAQNIAAQRIAATAEEKANTFIPPNRARQKAAQEAYEKGAVPEPVLVTTTE